MIKKEEEEVSEDSPVLDYGPPERQQSPSAGRLLLDIVWVIVFANLALLLLAATFFLFRG